MKSIIAIVGDYWHKATDIEDALRTVNEQLEDVQISCIPAESFVQQLGDKPDAVIIFRSRKLSAPGEEPPQLWMSEEGEAALVQYVETGGKLLAWHTALADYDKDGAYSGMLRGRFLHHPPMKQITYTDASSGETVLAMLDEHYFVEVDTEHTSVFLRSSSEDGEQIAGWTHNYGEGKVCCLTPGHTREGMHHPQFQALLAERLRLLLQ